MPRLLSINTYHYRRGGSDAVFFEHDALFRDIGWDTSVFTMHHPRNEPSEWSDYFANEIEFGHQYGLMDKLRMAGKIIWSLEAKDKINRLLDRFPADVAHAHCIYHHLSPSVLSACHERGIPTVMTAHDLKLACPAYKMLNSTGICERCKGGNLSHLLINRCVRDSLMVSGLVALESAVHKSLGLYRKNLNKIVVPSLFFKEKLIEWGWDEQMLEYIPNFIRPENYQPQYEPGDYFLYFGRLAPEKGVGTLIKAALKAGVTLRIAGTGPMEAELKAMVPAGNTQIEFMGFCGGEKLWSLVRGSRAVVLPSEWYENAPMSVLEAYACGKPVIGARIGGIPEMVQDAETGYLFESGDSDLLSDCLGRLEGMSGQEVMQLGKHAREYVAMTYNEGRYLASILGLYESLGVRVS